jgi:hypothetical protein
MLMGGSRSPKTVDGEKKVERPEMVTKLKGQAGASEANMVVLTTEIEIGSPTEYGGNII